MKRNFWWRGKTRPWPFAILTLFLALNKHFLDDWTARTFFGRDWSILNYLIPDGSHSLLPLNGFHLMLVLTGLPFALAFLTLAIRRLNDAELPRFVAWLLLMPIVNVLLFALLCLLPSRYPDDESEDELSRLTRTFRRLIPRSRWVLGIAAVFGSPIFAIAMTQLSTNTVNDYGWGLFVGVPFACGAIPTLIFGMSGQPKFSTCLGLSQLSLFITAFGLLASRCEGVICLLMAYPLAATVTFFGALAAYPLVAGTKRLSDPLWMLLVVLVGTPGMIVMEKSIKPGPTVFAVTTSVEIDAPPDVVWQNVISFGDLPVPQEWIFHTGVAYPVRAEMRGRGVGAVRHCVFTTGTFVEPITVWQESRLLRFSVTKNPPPMRELSFLGESHPPHLHGFLVSHQGQFRLVALLGGRTLLEGTTWYQHSMGPEWYWRLFSDRIIHAIHLRALGHVKSLSEDGSTMQSVTGRIANPPNDCGTLKRFERLIWQ